MIDNCFVPGVGLDTARVMADVRYGGIVDISNIGFAGVRRGPTRVAVKTPMFAKMRGQAYLAEA
ncbi:hypothetical protein COCC4DRAFT_31788 [Bipolaris maydis ATCC 48331]|uniref:Uncharacterized protein n=2 Tax=Cochliobolus heterostrophus TaxID=5016 RepID=M2TWX0_COCH5|nr:uncharacterized protein COCC4DRAFT_31788 [Bipolaris maydis ATCC 48331]EMD91019.1 hypothetical protein COCHEDRAFT_1021770 [Bipolaris maydis C5]ENI05898.1 hypothetical protein COCC4DRAFT_31788 [Bipolaris maydis ATCC 48331]